MIDRSGGFECFSDHGLVPRSALLGEQDADPPADPPADSSTWLHDGKVDVNLRFGDWYSVVGAAFVVKGATIGDWASAIEANRTAWPTDICGPIPAFGS